ncbi:MAG: DUF72 domain-containing protein [Hyphomicrobium sp.]|jgi:uncharacterized protein YecE (DUF72 family)
MAPSLHIGCAGWALRKENAAIAPPPGSHLERYARRFNAVEINSTFYRPHKRTTFERWADSVPTHFRFSVKMPKAITHGGRLANADASLARFLDEVGALGEKLGPLLIQLPPSLAFDKHVAEAFFSGLRKRFPGQVVCEPRHDAWFSRSATSLLRKFHISRVGADPAPIDAAARPAGYGGIAYYRLHGTPRMYYSAYQAGELRELAMRCRRQIARGLDIWCIFDNTAAGAALDNAAELQDLLKSV